MISNSFDVFVIYRINGSKMLWGTFFLLANSFHLIEWLSLCFGLILDFDLIYGFLDI